MNDQEQLIRQAIAYEAAEAVDSRPVLAALARKKRKPLRMIFGVAALAAATAAAAVIIPMTIQRANVEATGTGGPLTVMVIHSRSAEPSQLQTMSADFSLVRAEADGRVSAVRLSLFDIRMPNTGVINPAHEPETFREAVQQQTGVRIDHYVTVDTQTLGRLGTIVGGVHVCVKPKPEDRPGYQPPSPGRHSLAGDQLVDYLNNSGWVFPDQGTPIRGRWHAVLTGLAEKVDRDNADEVAAEVARSVRTDPGWDLLEFAERFRDGAQIRTTTLYVAGKPNAFRERFGAKPMGEVINDFFAGGPGMAEPGSPGEAPADECSY